MKHINLELQGEAVKQFFLSLPEDREGSLVELNGRAVARVTAMQKGVDGTADDPVPWTKAKNARRSFLVDREIDGTLTPDEAEELDMLQRQMIRERQKLAPVPLEDLRQLHEELLSKAQRQAGHEGP